MSYAVFRQIRRTVALTQQIRFESTLTNLTPEEMVFRPQVTQWTKVIREAEKIVGYPTSFMNLRWLLSDEFANVAKHLRKVLGSNHPIVHTAKTFLYNENNNLQPWGLIILLLSKAINPSPQPSPVAESQRALAELTEMIRTGHHIHQGIMNIPLSERNEAAQTSLFANKIALLVGDYLLVTANGMLARMKNQDLSFLISTALRDLSEGQFYGQRDKQNTALPGKPLHSKYDDYPIKSTTLPLDISDTLGNPIREWTVRTMHGGGSLFGRGCQGSMLLTEQDSVVQENAYFLGCHLCLAWQAISELEKFTSKQNSVYPLTSAPVLFAINDNPNLYSAIEVGIDNVSEVNFERLKMDILKTDAIERTRSLYSHHARKAIEYLELFGENQSTHTISHLIKAL